MNDEVDQKQDGESVAGEATSVGRSVGTTRRRLLRGGAAVAPVILTFTSRPVLGFEKACVTPSRMISGNFSGGVAGPTSCFGGSRRHWYDKVKSVAPEDWPGWAKLSFATGLAIHAVPYVSKSDSAKTTVGEVLIDSFDSGTDVGDDNANAVPGFASYIIAAYLTSTTIDTVTAVLKPAQVIHMWNDIVGTATGYCPQIGMCWNANGVIGYLQNSGIVPS